jgi:Ca2+-transporting ATPase
MTVQSLWTEDGEFELTGVGYEPVGELCQNNRVITELPDALKRLLLDGALCNDSKISQEDTGWKLYGDPTEGALVTSAMKAGFDVVIERKSLPRVDTIPFESEKQFMVTLHELPSETQMIIMKGAPEAVLRHCRAHNMNEVSAEQVLQVAERFAGRGMRVLAIAEKLISEKTSGLDAGLDVSNLRFIGLQGMIDPPRTEAIDAIKSCRAAGICVKMITGDHKGTAAAIGRTLGLLDDGRATSGVELEVVSDEELKQIVKDNNVFARVSPEHKLRLVRALQANGDVVAMTGDGVNDAPALKQANIGVAMGITGTAVSKEASDIVLADDNFASITAAVEEGRHVYDNLVKSLVFVLPTNLGLAFIFIYAVLFFPFDPNTKDLLLPMRPVQLLWINLVATVSLALPLAFEEREPDVMRRLPRASKVPILSKFVVMRTLLTATLMTIGAVGLFYFEYTRDPAAGLQSQAVLAEAQTITVTTVILFQIFYMFNCRSLRGSIFQIGITSNWTVFVGIATLLSLQIAFIETSFLNQIFGSVAISIRDCLVAAAVGASILPVISLEKWWRNHVAKAGRIPLL